MARIREPYIIALGLVLLYFLSATIGMLFTMTGFVQSDTCWLVKLGTLILKSSSIPSTDPLSFTLPLLAQAGHPEPFVVYQWLSEVIFAQTFRLFQLNGLLVLCSSITVLATVCILLRLCITASGSLWWSYGLVILATSAVALRLMVRPEVFTLLFIVIWLWLLRKMGNLVGAVTLLTALMMLWCNLHSGFVIGLLLLAVYSASYVTEDLVTAKRLTNQSQTALIALVGCLAATLINPAGLGLWAYLPRLFFPPVNLLISETQTVGMREMSMAIYYPYFLLVIISAYAILQVVRCKTKENSFQSVFLQQKRLAGILSIIIAIGVSLSCKRLVSPMALIVAFESAALLGTVAKQTAAPQLFSKLKSVALLEVASLFFATTAIFACSDRIAPLTMPQANVKFHPSFPAVAYMQEHWHGGNVFSDAQTGSMLTHYGPPGLKVFIDTRLDAYGARVLQDYCQIIDARDNYRDLLNGYLIDWVVATPSDRITQALSTDPIWTKEFSDIDAVIYKRMK